MRKEKYPNFGKEAILRNDIVQEKDIGKGISTIAETIPASKFVENLYTNLGRRIKATTGMGRKVPSAGVSKKEVKYALSTYDTDSESLTPERKKEDF